MSGIFGSLNTATKGLIAHQTALATTAHNISNANTEGFSRQRVDLKADTAYNYVGVGQLGTGVKMESIVRMVDDYVNSQIRNENGTLQRFTSQSDVLDQLEIIFNEPSDSGLNFNLGELFNSWQELSKNPENLNSKTVVVENAKTFADTLNHMSDQINALKNDTINDIQKDVFDFNAIVDKIEVLNKQIFNISVKGESPNDLLDQRDVMLKDLSSITNFETSYDKFGQVSLSIGGVNILGQGERYEMSTVGSVVDNGMGGYTISVFRGGDSLSSIEIFDVAGATNYAPGQVILTKKNGATIDDGIVADPSINSGQIMGKTEALIEIQDKMSSLDNYAKGLANAINTIHRYEGSADSGINFFTDDAGLTDITAGNIKVNSDILADESKVNAAYDISDPNSPEGDGSRALAIARLKDIKIDFIGNTVDYDSNTMVVKSDPDGATIGQAYQDMVIKVGISKEHADNMVENQSVLVDQLTLRKESVSGVSIDEEVTNMIKFQKTYEANAKVIQVLSEMLDTLINRTGV